MGRIYSLFRYLSLITLNSDIYDIIYSFSYQNMIELFLMIEPYCNPNEYKILITRLLSDYLSDYIGSYYSKKLIYSTMSNMSISDLHNFCQNVNFNEWIEKLDITIIKTKCNIDLEYEILKNCNTITKNKKFIKSLNCNFSIHYLIFSFSNLKIELNDAKYFERFIAKWLNMLLLHVGYDLYHTKFKHLLLWNNNYNITDRYDVDPYIIPSYHNQLPILPPYLKYNEDIINQLQKDRALKTLEWKYLRILTCPHRAYIFNILPDMINENELERVINIILTDNFAKNMFFSILYTKIRDHDILKMLKILLIIDEHPTITLILTSINNDGSIHNEKLKNAINDKLIKANYSI